MFTPVYPVLLTGVKRLTLVNTQPCRTQCFDFYQQNSVVPGFESQNITESNLKRPPPKKGNIIFTHQYRA